MYTVQSAITVPYWNWSTGVRMFDYCCQQQSITNVSCPTWAAIQWLSRLWSTILSFWNSSKWTKEECVDFHRVAACYYITRWPKLWQFYQHNLLLSICTHCTRLKTLILQGAVIIFSISVFGNSLKIRIKVLFIKNKKNRYTTTVKQYLSWCSYFK